MAKSPLINVIVTSLNYSSVKVQGEDHEPAWLDKVEQSIEAYVLDKYKIVINPNRNKD